MNQKKLINLTLLHFKDYRLFQNNTGFAWTGESCKLTSGDVLIKNPRPIRFGVGPTNAKGNPEGGSDLIGWDHMGLFTAIEIKSLNDRLTKTQKNFLIQVEKSGGKGYIVKEKKTGIHILRYSAKNDKFESIGVIPEC